MRKAPAPVSLSERIEEILSFLASETGMQVARDRYPCFLRVGDDWDTYSFKWEPFHDLAEQLDWPETSTPIVLVSSKEAQDEPLIGTYSEPHAHLRIKVSPALPVAAIVDKWIVQLAGYFPLKKKPAEWFLKNLQLRPADVTPAVRQFLGLERPTPKKRIEVSATVEGIAKSLGTSPVTAFAIAEALQKRHREYASNRLGGLSLKVPGNAVSHEWEVWRDSVTNLYNRNEIAKSHHEVIDGRLLLVGLGLLEDSLREALEKADVWAPLLLEIDEAVVEPSGPVRDALNGVQLAHGYERDSPDGVDQLGIQGEVNALCEVIMDPKVFPPLAVGLFGAWGSGKSFFMEKMRSRVYELTKGSPKNRPKNVVQIRFNAWHYADTSLWASLAVEIFERLADPEPVDPEKREKWLKDRGDPKKKAREKFLANLETYREAKAALEEEGSQLEQAHKRLESARRNAQTARKNALANSSLINVAAELVGDPEVKTGLERISKQLGLKPAVEQLTSIATELQTASGYLVATWRKIENKTWTAGLLMTAFVFLVLTAAVNLAGNGAWLGSLVPAIGSLVSAVAASTKHILPAAQAVNQALAEVSSTIEKVSQVEERLMAKRSRQEQELELKLAGYSERITEATRSIVALNEQIATLAAQAEALSVGRRLYDFLADRAAGYQKHQGVVGMLHRDFRLLDAQLRAQPSSSNKSGLPRIDRVVLYVDDLDRCSPAKVLEVLEAVHLLLALELFIVIVGVDPRWLQRSLLHQYRDLCLSEDLSKDPYLLAMPTEYLEKIFQIPLTLPAMEAKAYSKLISSLAPGTAVPTPSPAPEGSAIPTRRAASPDSPGGARTPTRALLQVQEGSAAQGRGGTSIDLTSDELQFVQQLGGLVDTPRAAKRLMNTYRLIRATQHVGSRSRFLGADGRPGEYYAVLTLLAVAAGYPTLADRVLVALEDDTEKYQIGDWETFLNELEPGKGKLVPTDIISPKDEDLISLAAAAEWENMFNGLKASLPDNQLHHLEPYTRWGRTVARFSFTL
jgi:KAP family P-loop domain